MVCKMLRKGFIFLHDYIVSRHVNDKLNECEMYLQMIEIQKNLVFYEKVSQKISNTRYHIVLYL